MIFVSTCSCLCPIHSSQVLRQIWRCSWQAMPASEWSSSLLPIKVPLISEVWRFIATKSYTCVPNILCHYHYNNKNITIICDIPSIPRISVVIVMGLTCNGVFRLTSHERHGVLNHWLLRIAGLREQNESTGGQPLFDEQYHGMHTHVIKSLRRWWWWRYNRRARHEPIFLFLVTKYHIFILITKQFSIR